ncbi:MAG: OmpA family protein [Porticoccaceae bacterium]
MEINTSILFASGSGQLMRDAQPVLEKLGVVLATLPNFVHVEGFTDDHPISTPIYPSNWELSAGRAATVVRLFAGYGVAPQRMTSIGYGEYRPIADNISVAGRAANRRVVVVVLADPTTASEPGRADEVDRLRGETKASSDPAIAPQKPALVDSGS